MDAQLFVTHAQMEDTHWWFLARRQILSAVLEACVPPGEGKSLIDIGCGTGGNSAALQADTVSSEWTRQKQR